MVCINSIERAQYSRQERIKAIRSGVITVGCLVLGVSGCIEGARNLPEAAEYDAMKQVCMTEVENSMAEPGINIAPGVSVRKVSHAKIEVTRTTSLETTKEQVDCDKVDESMPIWPALLTYPAGVLGLTGMFRAWRAVHKVFVDSI